MQIKGYIKKIINGEIIQVTIDNKDEYVKLYKMESPKAQSHFGRKGITWMEENILGKELKIILYENTKKDYFIAGNEPGMFGKHLCQIFLNKTNISQFLEEFGYIIEE